MDEPQPANRGAPTKAEVEAGARALAALEGATYFATGNVDGIEDYLERAQAVLSAALPLVVARLQGPPA